jgi:hypothetical protein
MGSAVVPVGSTGLDAIATKHERLLHYAGGGSWLKRASAGAEFNNKVEGIAISAIFQTLRSK